ncbi:MAG: hypothetical protein KKB37_02425 [Alphaproteobacteria bacterium]|nr:hypothetical protein [Alphaproteobacteria bacterium]
MDRRTFLKTTTAAAATTATAGAATAGAARAEPYPPAPSLNQTRHEWRIAVPPSGFIADAAMSLCRDIEIASGGRFVLHRVPVSADAMLGMSGAASFDGAFGHLAGICSAPELALFTGLPGDMGLVPYDLMAWHTAAGGGMLLEAAAAEYGVAAFIASHSGAGTGLWAAREIDDLSALAGMRIETHGLGRAIAETLHSAFSSSASERGWPEVTEIAAQPLVAYQELPPNRRAIHYRDGIHDNGAALALVVRREQWDRTSPTDRLLIEAVTQSAAFHSLAQVRAASRIMAPAVFASLPVRQMPLPADVSVAIRHTATEVTHETMSRTPASRRAVDAYAAFYEAVIGAPLRKPARFRGAGPVV